ncbi:MAG: HEAT repeat domain-containing protein, partial [Phycisphaerales bacterium]
SPDIAHIGEDPRMEALILERLLKYEDPSDFRQATVRALGAIGTEQALNALIALMRAIDEPCAEIAVSVGKISRRLGDTRAMPHLVNVYRTQPHTHGTGLPEEVLESLPPWPQRAVILALLTIGGEEGLQALKDLRADETHPALRQQLEDAIMDLRERLESADSSQPEQTNRDKRGNPELRDE